jgi:hypothetical protein
MDIISKFNYSKCNSLSIMPTLFSNTIISRFLLQRQQRLNRQLIHIIISKVR